MHVFMRRWNERQASGERSDHMVDREVRNAKWMWLRRDKWGLNS